MAVMHFLLAAAVLSSSPHTQVTGEANPPSPKTPPSSMYCGEPYMLCGLSLPKGLTCPLGPGWCRSGYYCGQSKSFPESACLPVPPDCGQVGKPCCPSNTVVPHTKKEDVASLPFCKGGAVCFSDTKSKIYDKPKEDYYTGQTSNNACLEVAADCGTAAGKPCCPNLFKMDANPPLASAWICGPWDRGLYCDYNDPMNAQRKWHERRGTCVANPPDCGTVGQPCCIQTTSMFDAHVCKPGPEGRKLWCDQAGKPTCKLCPPDPQPSSSPSDCRIP